MVWGYGYRIFRENRPGNQQVAEFNSERTLPAAVGRVIRFAGHAGIQVLELRPSASTCAWRIGDRFGTIGGVHAAAMALLAESATGYIVGLSLPAGKTPVKSMNIDYLPQGAGSSRDARRGALSDRTRRCW